MEDAASRHALVSEERRLASTSMQAAARRRAAAAQYKRVRRALIAIQSGLRRLRVVEIMSEVMMAVRMLRAGNIFMKFSHNGPPHDRWVWLDDSVRSIQWADPEKRKKGILKGADATLKLEDVVAISEGIKSELGKHQKTSFMQSMRAFKGGTSGIKSMDQDCCLTILGKDRSLDLQASSKMIRRDWLMAMRLLLTMRALAGRTGMEDIKDRRRLREFVKPKPRKRTQSRGAGFANFFGARLRAASGTSIRDSGSRPRGESAAGSSRTETAFSVQEETRGAAQSTAEARKVNEVREPLPPTSASAKM